MKPILALCTTGLLLAPVVSHASTPPPRQDAPITEEEAKATVAEFRKEISKCKTENDFIAALEKLGENRHPKILAELQKHLTKGTAQTRMAAAEQIAAYEGDQKASDALVAAAKSASSRKELHDVAAKCIEGVGKIGCRPATRQILGYFNHPETRIAREAVEACGTLGAKEAIDPLINLVRQLELIQDDLGKDAPPGDDEGGDIPLGEDPNVRRKKDLLNPAIEALQEITGEKHNTAKEWGTWWSKNKSTWKEREPEGGDKEEKK